MSSRFMLPQQIFGPNLLRYWDLRNWDTAGKIFRLTGGTSAVSANGQHIAHWKDWIVGTPLVASADADSPTIATNTYGTMPAAVFTDGLEGLVGDLTYSFTAGCQMAFIGNLTASAFQYRPLFGMSKNASTPITETPDSVGVQRNAANGIYLRRDEAAAGAEPLFVEAELGTSPAVVVLTLDKVADTVDVAWTSYKGIGHISSNGGHIMAYDSYNDQTAIDVTKVAVGSKVTDYFSSKFKMFGFGIHAGVAHPRLWQKFYDRYINMLMPGAF